MIHLLFRQSAILERWCEGPRLVVSPLSSSFPILCILPHTPLVLPVYVDVLNRVMLVCGGHTHDCGNDDVDGCSVHVCAECGCDCGGGDMCCGVVVDRAVVTTLAGSGAASFADGFGTNAGFSSPSAVAVDASGNVFVGDLDNHCIRKVTAGGGTRIGPVTLHDSFAFSTVSHFGALV